MAKRPTQPRPVAVKDILQGFLKPGDLEGLRVRQEIRRQELWVEVSDSHWAQELQFLKPRLLQELDRALGAGKVRDIRFRVGAFNQIREDTETS
jgi:predicted nucleic acid-binding Zn ribbon protein